MHSAHTLHSVFRVQHSAPRSPLSTLTLHSALCIQHSEPSRRSCTKHSELRTPPLHSALSTLNSAFDVSARSTSSRSNPALASASASAIHLRLKRLGQPPLCIGIAPRRTVQWLDRSRKGARLPLSGELADLVHRDHACPESRRSVGPDHRNLVPQSIDQVPVIPMPRTIPDQSLADIPDRTHHKRIISRRLHLRPTGEPRSDQRFQRSQRAE